MDENKKLWGIERRSDTPERILFICEALKKMNLPPDFSIVDIAGGRGVVLNAIAGLFPNCKPTIVDIKSYPEDWRKFRKNIKMVVAPLQDFIKQDNGHFDIVMMLNSYRTWKISKNLSQRSEWKKEFDKWLDNHASYFITSGDKKIGDIDGYDYRGILQLIKLPRL